MKPRRLAIDILSDIEQAGAKAVEFLGAMESDAFSGDEKTQFAIVRALEIVGEATKNVPPEIRSRYPDVPWRSMAAIRDKLIHDSMSVNPEIVWKTGVEDLPGLLVRLRAIIEQERD